MNPREPEQGAYEKYEVLYRRGTGRRAKLKSEVRGDLSGMRPCDTVTYYQDGYVSGVVEKANPRAGKLRITPVIFEGFEMRPGRTLAFSEVTCLLRPTAPDTIARAKKVLEEAQTGGKPPVIGMKQEPDE